MGLMEPMSDMWRSRMLSVLRIVAAFVFMLHGTQKLFAFPTAEPSQPVALMSLFGLAGILELVGGLLLLIGLFTRPVAFILAGEMAVAYFMVHFPQSFWPVLNQGEPAVLYCFIFLYLFAAGAGVWSVDAMMRERRGATTI